jgi:spermidine synthase
MSGTVPRSYAARTGVGIALLSVALMLAEIVLTRIFSVILWYHFAFFAISVALFGLGAAALAVHLLESRLAVEHTGRWLSLSALMLALTLVGVDLALVNVAPNWFGTGPSSAFTQITGKLVLLFLIASAPFLAGGFALALAFTRYSSHLSRLYFWDLVGAGLACLLVVPLLSLVGGPVGLLAAALLGAAAAIAFAPALRNKLGVAALAVAVATLLLGVTSPLSGWLDVKLAKGIPLDKVKPEYNRWNSFSMVTVLPHLGFAGWSASSLQAGRPVAEQKTLLIDLNAMTTLTRFSGDFRAVSYASLDLTAFVYQVKREAPRVCVIGAGGGKDVLAALASGAKEVIALEINPLIVNDLVRGKYREFTGGLYDRPDVRAVVDDGRSFVRRSRRQYDIVQLSMVDTSAATAAGAYALTENSLYTADSFRDFLAHLGPGGMLSVASVSLSDLAVGARLVAIARAALNLHRTSIEKSLIVLRAPWLGSKEATLYDVLVKPDGFDAAEADRAVDAADKLGFLTVYVPGRRSSADALEDRWIAEIIAAKDEAALVSTMSAWPLDVSATTDNRPFFFYQNRLSDFGRALTGSGPTHLFGNGLVIVSKVLLIALVLVVLFAILPLFLGRSVIASGLGSPGWDLGYACCLGLGFMFVEIPLIQRFALELGDPTATLSVVLFVLLVSGGIGSRLFAKTDERSARRLRVALIGVVLLALGFALVSDVVLALARPLNRLGRTAVAGLLLVPLGLALGVALPAGFAAVARRADARIPWLWSINSATSVLGSIAATLLALHAGISATLVAGAGFYALALLLSFRVMATDESGAFQRSPASAPESAAPSSF